MTKSNQILGLIAACQLVVIAFIYGFNQQQGGVPKELLSPVIASSVLTIANDQGATVTLRKESGEWHIDNYGDALADSEKIKTLLKQASELKATLPVGVTTDAQQRFNTADNQYGFKLTFASNDQQQTMLVGDSAGLRKTYLRLADSDDTYSLPFDRYNLSIDAASWVAKSQLAMPEVTTIRGEDFELNKTGDQWQLASDDDINNLNANALAGAIQNLKVTDVAPTAIVPSERNQLEIATDLATYRLRYWQQDDGYFAQRDDKKAVFKIAKSTFDTFNEKAKRVALMKEKADDNIATDEQEQDNTQPEKGNEVSEHSEQFDNNAANAG